MSKKVVFSLAFTICTCAFGNPQDGTVVSGDVVFRENGSTLTIEASDRSIIHWQDFSIGQGETTEFVQPTSNAAVLNRVTSDTPSQIFGSLLANGHVYLMNPNGILVGASGVINTGGFLATTLDQGPSNFFENGALELLGDSDAAIVNLGNITATGDIFLVARKIDNQGVIKSTNGMVGLAAGKDVLLKESGEERIFIRPVGEGEINSTGTIEALNIEIKSRGNPYSMAINLDGQLTANKVNEVDGRVFLSADNGNMALGSIVKADGLEIEGADAVTVEADIIVESEIHVNVGNLMIDETVEITSEGIVTVVADLLLIADRGNISSTGGGDIEINTSYLHGDGITISNPTNLGDAGNIIIDSGLLSITDDRSLIVDSGVVNTISISDNSDDLGLTVGSPVSVFQQSDAIELITTSSRYIIEYSNFNISAGDTADFVQPRGNSSVLNRINSDTPSQILGTLSSNGIVYLVNPSGLVIQPIVFRPLITQPVSDYLNSPFFDNIKSGKSVVQDLRSPVLKDNAEGTLLAKFSTQAEDDGRSIINLNR